MFTTKVHANVTTQEKITTVINHLVDMYTKGSRVNNGVNIPSFMNQMEYKRAYQEAIQMAQDGTLNSYYNRVLQGTV